MKILQSGTHTKYTKKIISPNIVDGIIPLKREIEVIQVIDTKSGLPSLIIANGIVIKSGSISEESK